MRVAQAFRTIAIAVLLSAEIGCGAEAVQRTAPAAQEHFARQYFRVLADSGVEAVLPLTKSQTRAIPDLPQSLRALRTLLQQIPPDSLELRRWKVSVETGSPPATKVTYLVRGVEGRFLVGLWIEKEAGTLVASTVFCGPEPSTGHLRGDS
jgi:hypothetical protein